MTMVRVKPPTIRIYSSSRSSPTGGPDYLFDVSEFRDPMGQQDLVLACRDGRDEQVKSWIKLDDRLSALEAEALILAGDQLTTQGRASLSLGYRCFHGRWIAPAVAELMKDLLGVDYDVEVTHHGL